jgi:MFS family permease
MNSLLNFSLLKKNKNFRLLYLGQFISFFGTMITGIAVPYQIYQLTHSTLIVGLISLIQLLPLLFTALIGGVFADRYQRRKLLLISEVILAVGCLVLAVNSIFVAKIWLIFLVGFLMSSVTGLHRPALESMVQQLVDREDFPAVSSLGTFKFSMGMILGPAVGGLIIAYLGIFVTYIVDFLTMFFSIGTLLMMKNLPKLAAKQISESTWSSLKQGFRYATSKQELMGTYFVDFIAMIFGMPTALFPALAVSFGGAKALGMLYAAPAVGALVVSFISGWAKINRHGLAVAISAVCWGISILFFGLVSQFWLALFFLALAGASDAISGIFRGIMWNQIIPNEYRGRLAGIEMIGYLSGPKLGDTEAGLVAARFGITDSIVSGGVLCILGVLICSFYMPKFLAYRAEEEQSLVEELAESQ